MAISKFSVETSTNDMSLFYTFLNANKAGTFLENMEIELSEDSKTLTITSSKGTKITIVTGDTKQTFAVKFEGKITTNIMPYDTTDKLSRLTSALLCNNGIIVDIGTVVSNAYYHSPQVMITVDNTGDLAVIFKNTTGLTDGNHNVSITSYRVTAADSTSQAVVTLTPQYGAQKTSLAPIVPMCNDNSISLPYAYAALHTQASGMGLQSMAMEGFNYITNGCWYIKDGA